MASFRTARSMPTKLASCWPPVQSSSAVKRCTQRRLWSIRWRTYRKLGKRQLWQRAATTNARPTPIRTSTPCAHSLSRCRLCSGTSSRQSARELVPSASASGSGTSRLWSKRRGALPRVLPSVQRNDIRRRRQLRPTLVRAVTMLPMPPLPLSPMQLPPLLSVLSMPPSTPPVTTPSASLQPSWALSPTRRRCRANEIN